jgi:protein NUD1
MAAMTVPAWQTEELEDEWPDIDGEDDATRSLSMTLPLDSHICTPSERESVSLKPVGTFVVHHNMQNGPVITKTPAQNKVNIKDFFSPLPLERMFNPPTPPQSHAQKLDRRSPTPCAQDTLTKPSPNPHVITRQDCPFTFSAPRQRPMSSSLVRKSSAQSIQHHTSPPTNSGQEPPLRLFQFQYDTFTREHLSAMVDSIAIHSTPSGERSTPSPAQPQHVLSRVSEDPSNSSFSRFRSAKRIKLSPPSDYPATSVRVKTGKDYIGASRSLMDQIRQAHVTSTVPTSHSAEPDPPAEAPAVGSSHGSTEGLSLPLFHLHLTHSRYAGNSSVTQLEDHLPPVEKCPHESGHPHSSIDFRQRAASLMRQIKKDAKAQRRIVSGESHIDETTHSIQNVKEHLENPLVVVHEEKENRSSLNSSTLSSKHKSRSTPLKTFHLNFSTSTPHEPVHKSFQQLDVSPHVMMVHVPPDRSSHGGRFLAPPSQIALFNSSQRRPSEREDLNRFVSSSTASGTTLTCSTVPSCVKHQGPAHIRTIAPSDVPVLPERLGNMYFDRATMKWVKSSSQDSPDQQGFEDVSEDPFEDIESLRDDSSQAASHSKHVAEEDVDVPFELSRVEERSEFEEDEPDMTSFESDIPSARVVEVMTGVETDDSMDSEDDHVDGLAIQDLVVFDSEDEAASTELVATPAPASYARFETPDVGKRNSSATPIKSALKANTATPASAQSMHNYQTPMRSVGHRRSVSFSDGKRDGPIRGLGWKDESIAPNSAVANSFVPSARSKRIADMMDALDNSGSFQYICSQNNPSFIY